MIICITGPTGVGKTDISIKLAKKYNAIVVNADATQIYKELDIGSAKITTDEMQGVKHYLIDIKNPNEEYSSCDYQMDARKILEEHKNENIIVTGGTGLYLKSLFYDYEFSPVSNINYDNYTNEELYDLVLEKDPNSKIHINNRIRMISFLKSDKKSKNGNNLLYDCIFIGLTMDRSKLYERCNKRVDIMFENGLVDEVNNLLKKYPDSGILKRAIGYKEVLEYLNGNISLEEAKELVKKNTRHYVKRQYTWFNNQMNLNWFNKDENLYEEITLFIDSLNSK